MSGGANCHKEARSAGRAKAIHFYKKFLSLWKDADMGRVEVENARKSLAALKSP